MNGRKAILYPVFAVGFAAGLAFGHLWLAGLIEKWSAVAPSSLAAATASGSVATSSSLVMVKDQAAGDSVYVDQVTATTPVWVAVREMGAAGLGNVLGALRVSGSHDAVSVPLLRITVAGARYAVELYRDDAGNEFDPAKNSVYVDGATGAPAISYFATTP
jgi:hypothetical protein